MHHVEWVLLGWSVARYVSEILRVAEVVRYVSEISRVRGMPALSPIPDIPLGWQIFTKGSNVLLGCQMCGTVGRNRSPRSTSKVRSRSADDTIFDVDGFNAAEIRYCFYNEFQGWYCSETNKKRFRPKTYCLIRQSRQTSWRLIKKQSSYGEALLGDMQCKHSLITLLLWL